MFGRDQIDQVRSSVDIVDIVREFVPSLRVTGRSAKGLCPFHSERTPSFHVHAEKGIFKCFGCGEAGDVISFISKIEQVSFTEAVERLAEKAGIRLAREKNRPQEPEGLREKLFRVLEAAKEFYAEQLWSGRPGEAARAYLAERGIEESTSHAFQ